MHSIPPRRALSKEKSYGATNRSAKRRTPNLAGN